MPSVVWNDKPTPLAEVSLERIAVALERIAEALAKPIAQRQLTPEEIEEQVALFTTAEPKYGGEK